MCNTEPVHVEVSTPTSESLPHLDLVTANQYVGTAHISLDGPFPYPSFRSFLFFSVQCLIFQLLKELLWMCPFTSCGTKFTTPLPHVPVAQSQGYILQGHSLQGHSYGSGKI